MNKINKMSKFAVVGVFATAIHVLIASSLITGVYKVNPGYANCVAFIIATSFSYIVNTKWSFADQFRRSNLFRFTVTALVGCALAYGLSSMAEHFGLHYLIGIGFVVICVPGLSFLAHYFWTYRSNQVD